MTIDHIGYLSADIHKSIKSFCELGYVQDSEIYVDDKLNAEGFARNVYICFLSNGDTRIELVSPIDNSSDVYSTLKRQGEGPYHICYRISNLEDSIRDLCAMGWKMLKRPSEAMALNNSMVAFMYKKSVGLIELVEKV